MKPDYYKKNTDDQYRKKKSKSTGNKEKKAKKNKIRGDFRNHVQDFLDKRDDKDYNINKE